MKMNVKKFFGMFQRFFLNKKVLELVARLFIFFIIVLFLLYFLIKANQKKKIKGLDTTVKMSIFNDGSSGTMAFKELLESLNYKVDKIMEPLNSIGLIDKAKGNKSNFIDNQGIILIIEPEAFFQKKDNKTLEKIAGKGSIIMIFSELSYKVQNIINPPESDDSFFSEEDLKVYRDASSDLIKISYDRNRIFYDVRQLFFRGRKRINKFGKGWKVIARDKEGILIIEKKVGKGSIIVVSESGFISNLNIREHDNALFGCRLVSFYSRNFNDKNIYFDEFHHGFHKKYTLLYFIARKEYFAIILQAIIFFIFIFYLINIKFGQLKIFITNERKKIFYFSESMAGLLIKRKYSGNIYEKLKNNYHLLTKLKPYNFNKENLENIDSFIEKNKKKKKRINLIKKLFLIIKKNTIKK